MSNTLSTESTCANCSHWASMNEKKGKCMRSKAMYGKMYSGCGLITSPDFGCTEFYLKNGTANHESKRLITKA